MLIVRHSTSHLSPPRLPTHPHHSSDLLSSPRAGTPTSDEPYGSDRARLLSGTAILEDGTRRLQESQRIALETEGQGADVLRVLREQREQIENSRNTVRV